MKTETDVSDTIVARSDQLNADDLISGPITVTITGVKRCSDEQPLAVEITGHQPFKPCKTMRRVLITAWGKDATKWTGKTLILYRDAKVKWGGEVVGGIRIQAMSHISANLEVSLAETRGKKKMVTVARIADQKATTTEAAKKEDTRTKVEKYRDWLPTLDAAKLLTAYKKFDTEVQQTLPESEAQAIYMEFAKYAPQQKDEP